MTEQLDCEITGGVEDNGQTLQLDLKLRRNGREYFVSVAGQDYIDYLSGLPRDSGHDTNIYALPNLEDVCGQLSQIPDEVLMPSLRPIQPEN